MAVPASVFRPHGPAREEVPAPASTSAAVLDRDVTIGPDGVIEPPPAVVSEAAIEWEIRVPPRGKFPIVSGRRTLRCPKRWPVEP
jgi:hypothetical protein